MLVQVIQCTFLFQFGLKKIQWKHEAVVFRYFFMSFSFRRTLSTATGGPGNTEPEEHTHVPVSDRSQRQAAAQCAAVSGLPDICSCFYASEDTEKDLAETSA